MKKLILPLIGLMGLVGATSCSQDDVKVPAQDGVTFTVQLPRSVQSRGTFGDGTDNGDRATLNNLQYSVYEVTNNVTAATPLFSGAVDNAFTTDQTQETVTIPLAKGKSYQVVFYADDSDNDFVTYTDGTINVVYANSESNVAAEDAFIGKSEQFTVNGAYSETVTLTRPFAQLNWGSDDTDAKVLTEVLKTLEATVTVSSGLYTSMDVLTGTVSDQVTTATTLGTVSFASLPEQTFPVAGTTKPYALIAMNYLLTGNGTINCELSFSDTDIPAVEVSAAPVQINHRTNIYGSLLTNPGTFNIIVDNNFADPDNNITNEPTVPKQDENGVYLMATQGDLAWLSEQVKNGNAMSGSTFSLQNDITLVGEWTPIGGGGQDFNVRFSGKFLGNNHTIYNMKVNAVDRAGFFGFINGTVEDLNFENAEVNSTHWAGVVAGYSDNETGTCYIKNCKVTNSSVTLTAAGSGDSWDDGDKGGLIIGFMAARDQVTGCTVTNCTLQGYRDLGGIIGYASGSVITDNTVNGLKIFVDNTHNYKNYSDISLNDANPMIGEATSSVVNTGNTYSGVTIGYLNASETE